jgi:zinc protease
VFSAGIKAAATDSALVEVLKELNTYAKSGIQDSELLFMRSAIGQRDALRYETGFQKTSFIANILRYNLPDNFVEQQSKIVSTITKDELNKLAIQWIDTSKMNILLVGDKAAILPGLKRLGYEIIELDVNGNKKGVIN